MALTQTRSENKPLLQDHAGFLQEITSTAVEVGLEHWAWLVSSRTNSITR